ncbi:putative serine/threonine-protein kinase PBL11 [Bidens hawaiensis]|uniref:putative serine/threonine-protein kinase PBL11 n=1 Tax=Bidens hawaiensis TaxID=980011 RepID=UPI00404A64A3
MSQMGDTRPMSSSPQPEPSFSNENLQSSILVNKYLWITLIVCSFMLLVAVVLCLCNKKKVFVRFKWHMETKNDKMDAHELMLRKFQVEELETATNNFAEECLVGSGAFGNVYKGTFEGDVTLAIKKACDDSYTSTHEFRNEVKLISKVKHPNLVGLVGYCEETGRKGVQILVYEYVPNGSLLEHIVGRDKKPLTWRQRVNIAIQAAKGIAHLHEGIKPSIIHRDIKPSNILIGDGFEAKVSDFGLVRSGPVGDNSYVSSQIKGTPGYLDPAYCTSFHLSPFSDVYSFGVILLQLIAARPAVDSNRSRSNYHIIDWARPHLERGNVEEILDANLLIEPCNMDIMLKMGLLGLRCVVKEPKQRPTMTQVHQELETALWSVERNVHRQVRPRSSTVSISGRSRELRHGHMMDHDSSVSLDGIGLQRFRVDMDSLSLHSVSMRCLESDSIVFHIDDEGRAVDEEMSFRMDDQLSVCHDC